MVKAVFTTRVEPTYDDLPEARYHFPHTYLGQVEAAVGDDIVYYEPRRTGRAGGPHGRQAYFASARVKGIVPDRKTPGHSYALIEDYLEFVQPVPFRDGARYYESGLRRPDGQTSKGAFGRAVRPLSDVEFLAITQVGFAEALSDLQPPGVADRPRILNERAFRDRAFTLRVRRAYASTCAMTGLRIVNGGGWTEAQAAHIRPVADAGPDSLRNGLLLSSTMHALFDRGFVAVDHEFRIVIARTGLPDTLRGLLAPDRNLILPVNQDDWPHPAFLAWHREKKFKG